jgi:hypothetical protein
MTEGERIAEEVFNTMDGKVKCRNCGKWKPQRNILPAGVCWACIIIPIESTLGIEVEPAKARTRLMGDFSAKVIHTGTLMKSIKA